MARIDEINTRLTAIAQEAETATGDVLTALETETNDLVAERQQIMDEVQKRQQLRQNIAAGIVTGKTIENKEENPMENRNFTTASEEYRSAFLKRLRREDLTEVETRAFTFLTTNTAAPLPQTMQNRIIDLIGEAHPIVADVYSLNSGSAISIPVGKSITADAGRSAEGEAANEMQIEFDDITLAGEDHTANVKMSYKMMHMAIDAFEDYLVTKIAERLGAVLAGDIVAKIKAGMNAANKSTAGVSYASVCAGFGALKRVGAVVVYGTRETIFNKIVGMVDGNKRPIFQQPITAAAAGVLLGATIKYEDAMGAGELLIGDPKKYLQNVVAPIIIENAKDLDNHKVVFSGYTCQEGTLTDDKAFALVAEAAG
jgi:HK97 family phage major capsid protein